MMVPTNKSALVQTDEETITPAQVPWTPPALLVAASEVVGKNDPSPLSKNQKNQPSYEKDRCAFRNVMHDEKNEPTEISERYIKNLYKLEQVGKGSFGVVYKVKDHSFKDYFALKQFKWVCPNSTKRKRTIVCPEFVQNSVQTEIAVRCLRQTDL